MRERARCYGETAGYYLHLVRQDFHRSAISSGIRASFAGRHPGTHSQLSAACAQQCSAKAEPEVAERGKPERLKVEPDGLSPGNQAPGLFDQSGIELWWRGSGQL